MAYTWNADYGIYVDDDGEAVPAAQITQAAHQLIAAAEDDVDALSAQVSAGTLTPARWEARMATTLRDAHLAATALAVGGWAQMTAGITRSVVDRLTQQFLYLADYRAQVTDLSPAAVQARSQMYAGAVWGSFQAGKQQAQQQRPGERQERNIEDEAADHCNECHSLTKAGWQPLGSLPLPGSRECLSRCQCDLEYRTKPEKE